MVSLLLRKKVPLKGPELVEWSIFPCFLRALDAMLLVIYKFFGRCGRVMVSVAF